MRVMVIGSSGQLGFDLTRLLVKHGHTPIPIEGRAELDINDVDRFPILLIDRQPEAVINTAAFHHVDACETQYDTAFHTNVVAVRQMAKACEARKVPLFQISTDYVMEGYPENRPLPETAAAAPVSIYALTRFGGECMTLAHAPTMGYVVRSCGLFGVAGCKLRGGVNFVDLIIKAAREGKPLRVVNDQIVAPTPTDLLAEQLIVMLAKRVPAGLYHAVSHGQCSWYELALVTLAFAGIEYPVQAVPSAVYAAPAKRPRYSVLENAKLQSLGLDGMRDWKESLQRYVNEKYPRG